MKNKVKEILSILALVVAIGIISSCTKKDPTSDYSPPADHTVSQNGFMHKPGFDQPLTNCTTCHGVDLTGGTTEFLAMSAMAKVVSKSAARLVYAGIP